MGWNVKSGHWDSKALLYWQRFPTKQLPHKTQFPLSRRSSYAESRFSSLSGPHQWSIWGTEQMGDSSMFPLTRFRLC